MPDHDIDRLYQLSLEEFTSARNDLVRRLRRAGATSEAAEVSGLPKPTLPAWAANQLYWHGRPKFDALMKAGHKLRQAHEALLAGRRADVRAASDAHREALRAAVEATAALLDRSGHSLSAAARDALSRTLESLSTSDSDAATPGRLAQPLGLPGFEALTGVSVTAAGPPARAKQERRVRPAKEPGRRQSEQKRESWEELKAARNQLWDATREHRDAQRTKERTETALASAKKQLDSATRERDRIREGLEQAEKDFGEAKHALDTATREADVARRAAEKAEQALDEARVKMRRLEEGG